MGGLNDLSKLVDDVITIEVNKDITAKVKVLSVDDGILFGDVIVYNKEFPSDKVDFYIFVDVRDKTDDTIIKAIKEAVKEQYQIELIKESPEKVYRVEEDDYTAYIKTFESEILSVTIKPKEEVINITPLLDVIDAIEHGEINEKYGVDYDIEKGEIIVREIE